MASSYASPVVYQISNSRKPLINGTVAGGMFTFFAKEAGTLRTVGVFLTILLTVPFYLATLFCFSQSSRKLHDWFIGMNLYKSICSPLWRKRKCS